MTICVKWLGHASFQIRTASKIIYVDLKKYGKVVETSEKADIILVTHNHGDHCSPPKIEKLRKKDTIIIAPKNCVSRIDGNVKTLKPREEITVDGVKIEAVEAYNIKRVKPSGKPWHPKGYGVGYLIKTEGKIVYHAGDTDFIPEMRQLQNIDLALLPTGDKYTMDNAEAAEAAITIKPKTAMAMHTWEKDREEFKKKTEANSKTQVILLQEGEEYQLKSKAHNAKLYIFNCEGARKLLKEGAKEPLMEENIKGLTFIDFNLTRRGAYLIMLESHASTEASNSVGVVEKAVSNQDLLCDSATILAAGIITAVPTFILTRRRRTKQPGES